VAFLGWPVSPVRVVFVVLNDLLLVNFMFLGPYDGLVSHRLWQVRGVWFGCFVRACLPCLYQPIAKVISCVIVVCVLVVLCGHLYCFWDGAWC